MKLINKEFDLKVSYTGCRSLMKQAKQVDPDSERGQAKEIENTETVPNSEEA